MIWAFAMIAMGFSSMFMGRHGDMRNKHCGDHMNGTWWAFSEILRNHIEDVMWISCDSSFFKIKWDWNLRWDIVGHTMQNMFN